MEAVADRLRALPWREVERPALVMAWVAGLLLTIQAVTLYVRIDAVAADSYAYWLTGQGGPLYHLEPGVVGAFNYSPAFAQVVWPLTQLPWPVFAAAWMALEVAAFVWLLRPLGWRWVTPLVLLCVSEWLVGNVMPFLAIAVVLGMRRSGWWSVVALVKPTMALGPVWFAARGEWRKVRASATVTAAVMVASYLLWPGAWAAWVSFLADNAGADPTLPARVAAAVLLTVVAARLDARWLLAGAMLLATPVWSGTASITLLAVLPRLLGTHETGPPSEEDGPVVGGLESGQRRLH